MHYNCREREGVKLSICSPYLYWVYVVLICTEYMQSLSVLSICSPYLYWVYAVLICTEYMQSLSVLSICSPYLYWVYAVLIGTAAFVCCILHVGTYTSKASFTLCTLFYNACVHNRYIQLCIYPVLTGGGFCSTCTHMCTHTHTHTHTHTRTHTRTHTHTHTHTHTLITPVYSLRYQESKDSFLTVIPASVCIYCSQASVTSCY